jgi:hypothetical protein
MYLSLVSALSRKDGKVKILAVCGSPMAGAQSAEVAATYQKALSSNPEGAKLREAYSHLVYIVDNAMRGQHHFPDLQAQAEIAEKDEKFANARVRLQKATDDLAKFSEYHDRLFTEHEAARAEFVQAGGQVAEAPSAIRPALALRSLENDHSQLLQEHQAATEELEKLRHAPPTPPSEPTQKSDPVNPA